MSLLPRRGLIDPGNLITVFVVSMGLLVALIEANFPIGLGLKGGVLALLYIGVVVGPGERLDRSSRLLFRISYFVTLLTLLVLLSFVFNQYRVFSTIWLFFMPCIAQSRMLLPAFGTAAVSISSLGILMALLQSLAGWDDVPSSLFALSTAVAFVLVFTDFAMREAAARADSQRLSEELERANKRLGDYAVQAEELSAARERTRMAREIHDSVGHSLTALHMQLQAAQAMLGHDTEKARDALEKARRCAQDGLSEIRQSVSALRADPLDGRNLHGALADLADMSSSSGLPVHFKVRGHQRPLSPATTLALYRSAQEGLTNAKKHAQARKVEVELDYGEKSVDGVRLVVEDDGIGSERLEGGYGLIGLSERARQLEGHLDVTSRPSNGVRLVLTLPSPLDTLGEKTNIQEENTETTSPEAPETRP